MPAPIFQISFLLAGCFTIATWLGPRLETLAGARAQDTSLLGSIMGDSRRLFANHFFKKSDVYMHSGYYPTFFDEALKENHLAQAAGAQEDKHEDGHEDGHEEPGGKPHKAGCTHGQKGHVHDEKCEHHDGEDGAAGFLGKPRDWIDAFSRDFFVSKHSHLGEDGNANAAREILPWLKISAELDSKRVESFTVGAYWLRNLKKNDAAEQFLRAGLRANPDSYEILFELGRCFYEKNDLERARNLWELSMQRWRDQENPKPQEQQDRFMAVQILTQLARLESRAGRREVCLGWLVVLKKASKSPDEIQKRIDEVKAGQPFAPEEK